MIAEEMVIYLLMFFAVSGFIWVGADLFSKGWATYEGKYVQGAEQSLDAMYLTMPPQVVLYLSVACAFFSGLVVFAVTGEALAAAPISLVGLAVPQLILKALKAKRQKDFGFQLVEALDAMGNAMRAGLSFPQALEMIHREMPNPIAQEFRLVTHEMRFGARVEDALKNLSQRMPNPDLELIITAITIAQEVGGNLSEVFGNISNTVRQRHAMEDKIRALTGQGKMQGVVLCLLPFAVGGFLAAVYPEMIQPMFESLVGLMLIGMIFVLIFFGGFFIKKIVTIDV